MKARHLFLLPSFVAFRRLSGVLERSSQILLFNLRPVVFGLRLLLFQAIGLPVHQVRRRDIIELACLVRCLQGSFSKANKGRRVVGFRTNGEGSGFAVRQNESDAKLEKAK